MSKSVLSFICGALFVALCAAVKVIVDLIGENDVLEAAVAGLAADHVSLRLADVPEDEL